MRNARDWHMTIIWGGHLVPLALYDVGVVLTVPPQHPMAEIARRSAERASRPLP